MKFLIVGAGLSGAVIANELSNHGFPCDVIDKRSHLAGNIFTRRDSRTGVLVHEYGPHIFNTNDETVWNFVNSLVEFDPFINRVKSVINGSVFSLPINLHTLNQFFGKSMTPSEAKLLIEKIRDKSIKNPANFEEQALSLIGQDLYEAFFKGYTIKQWGCDPREIPASVLKRLPIRFNYDDNYYDKRYQGIPKHGYTGLVEKLLDHPNISVHLNINFSREMSVDYSAVFYSGKIDEYFDYTYGPLGYRTVFWENSIHQGDYQGNAVLNYPELRDPFTRVIEHAHFQPRIQFQETIVSHEYSKETELHDEPFYPKRLKRDMDLLHRYQDLARLDPKVEFVGRLGTYRYLDMDITISEALSCARATITKFI